MTSASIDLDDLHLPDEIVEYYKAARKHERWRDRKKVIKEEFLGIPRKSENVAKKRIEDSKRTSNKHDELLTALASGFHNRSFITGETDWRLEGIEPLYEFDPNLRNPDAILGHPDRDHAITIECKTGLAQPRNCLTQIREAATNVLSNEEYIARKADTEGFDSVEMVLLVPGSISNKASRAIEAEIEEESPDEPIYLWKYYTFKEERLQIHTSFSNRTVSEATHDNQITPHLTDDGISVSSDPLAVGDFYPESSTFKIMNNVCFEVASDRAGTDTSVRKLSKEEVRNEIDDPSTMIHYSISEVADIVADRLLEKLNRFDLIKPVDPEEDGLRESVNLFEYESRVDGSTVSTLMSNLEEAYLEEWQTRIAEREAIKQTVDEFRDGQSGLPSS